MSRSASANAAARSCRVRFCTEVTAVISEPMLKPAARPPPFSAEEWKARVELAACYRIFAHLGWVDLIYNHITLRLPGPEKHFLINPFGLMYSEVRASNLVKIDLQGNIVGASDWPVNPAG